MIQREEVNQDKGKGGERGERERREEGERERKINCVSKIVLN